MAIPPQAIAAGANNNGYVYAEILGISAEEQAELAIDGHIGTEYL
jgi:hypothetical protein